MSSPAPKILAASALLASMVACAPRDATAPDASATAARPGIGTAFAAQSSDARSAPAGTAAEPVYRTFRDVVVACDNVRRCAAIGVGDGASGLVLSLRRDAGADGAQALVLQAPGGTVGTSDMTLDGAAAPAIVALPWQRDASESATVRIEDPTAIARFIDLVRDGTHLGDGAERSVSLSGLNAALLYIDEHQQRLDTPGAWGRRGERDDAAVPPAPALPVLAKSAASPPPLPEDEAGRLIRSVREAQAAALHAEECDAAGGAFDVSRQDAAFPLDATQALVFVTCYSGAYQSAALVFRAARDGTGATRLTLPAPRLSADSEPREDFRLLVGAGYDPRTGTLSQHARGRGIGDCGYRASWQFDGQAFALSHYAEMTRCGGLGPDDWPVLWRVADPATGMP